MGMNFSSSVYNECDVVAHHKVAELQQWTIIVAEAIASVSGQGTRFSFQRGTTAEES